MTQWCPSCSKKKKEAKERFKTKRERRGPINWEWDKSSVGGEGMTHNCACIMLQGHTHMHTHTHSHKGHYFTTVLQHKQRVEFSWWRQEVAVNSCWQFWSLLNINTSHTFNSVLLERASPKKKWKSCILHFGNVILFHFRSNDDDC